MGATVFSLGAVRIVWYSLSGFSVLPSIFQTDGQNWLVITLRISSWVSCMGPPCVRIGNKLGGMSVVCRVRCMLLLEVKIILPLELYSLCIRILWLSCVSLQVGSPR